MLADVVGAQVAAFRKRKGLTREALAEAVTKDEASNWNLTTDVVTNIETRRSKGRAGAREVTVDEITALARALGVPPVMLLFPVGASADTDIGYGQRIGTWQSLRWFTGEASLDGRPLDNDPGAAPITLYRRFQQAVDQYMAAQEALRSYDPDPDGKLGARELTPGEAQALAVREAGYVAVVAIRAEIQRADLGKGLPPLPEPIARRLELPGQVQIEAYSPVGAGTGAPFPPGTSLPPGVASPFTPGASPFQPQPTGDADG